MTAEAWFAIGRELVMWGVAALVFFWGLDRKKTEQIIASRFQSERESLDQKLALRDLRLASLESALTAAREHSSNAANRVTVKIDEIRDRLSRLEHGSRRTGV